MFSIIVQFYLGLQWYVHNGTDVTGMLHGRGRLERLFCLSAMILPLVLLSSLFLRINQDAISHQIIVHYYRVKQIISFYEKMFLQQSQPKE